MRSGFVLNSTRCTLRTGKEQMFYFFPIIHTNKLNACVETVTRLKGGMRDGGKQLKRLDGGQTKWLSGESRWLVKDTEVGRNTSRTRKQPKQTHSLGLE